MDAEKVRIFVPYQNTVSPSDGRRDVDKVNERSAVPLVDTWRGTTLVVHYMQEEKEKKTKELKSKCHSNKVSLYIKQS